MPTARMMQVEATGIRDPYRKDIFGMDLNKDERNEVNGIKKRLWFNLGWCLTLVIVWTIILELTGNRWGSMSDTLLTLFIASLVMQAFFHWEISNHLYPGRKLANLGWVLFILLLILVGVTFGDMFVIGWLVSLAGG